MKSMSMFLRKEDRDGYMKRTARNLHPHAEARLAMALWGHEYAHEQKGGSMDFWDSRTPGQKQLCVSIVDGIMDAAEKNGRAPTPPASGAGEAGRE